MSHIKCPECQGNAEYTGEEKLSESGELYYVKIFTCTNCGMVFDEEEV